ncbi:MAG: sulfatase [Chthonomonadales bacterium]|nr:sulfatase [Chthonomonadales bacterium]
MTHPIPLTHHATRRSRPPNIVLILIDDLGWRDLACSGSPFYLTPRLDRLAAEGMRFTAAYAACPVCSPTRASIMTGKYPARLGLTNYIGGQARGRLLDAPYIDHLALEETSLASALREGGYATWHVGKWHLGDASYGPERHGFDVNVAGCAWGHPHNGYFSPWGIPGLPNGPPGQELTDRLTDEAIARVRGAGDRPFFLNLWHYAVHTPIEAAPALVERFRARAADLGLDGIAAVRAGEPFPCEHKRHLRVTRRIVQSDPAYAAMVHNLDRNVGRLLDTLEECGLVDDTLVLFTSDNGGLATSEGAPTSNLPLAEGKGWCYEGGTRVPLVVRWPGHASPGEVCDTPVVSTDVYPTLLAAAGLPARPDQHVDGVSLVPLLLGARRLERDAIFWHYPHYGNQGGTPASAVRMGDHKLIEFHEDGRLELYNLSDDPGETRDRAAIEPDRAARMRARLAAWRDSVCARIPAPNPNWQPAL